MRKIKEIKSDGYYGVSGQKIEFNKNVKLTGKEIYEILIKKAELDLNEYSNSGRVKEFGILSMSMPAFHLVGENANKIFKLLNEYINEVGEPYVDDFETMVEEPKFND